MLKRSLASLAAVAVVTGAVVAPANAMTLKVNDDTTCTMNLTEEEAGLIETEQTGTNTNTTTKAEAAKLLADYPEALSGLRAEIANVEKGLADPELDAALKESLTRHLEQFKKRVTLFENWGDALKACVAGKDYNSNEPGGSNKPDDSNKPDGPNKPGDGHASSSIDGAGIGVIVAGSIVALLGILAAALPVIKPMLPAQLKALLP